MAAAHNPAPVLSRTQSRRLQRRNTEFAYRALHCKLKALLRPIPEGVEADSLEEYRAKLYSAVPPAQVSRPSFGRCCAACGLWEPTPLNALILDTAAYSGRQRYAHTSAIFSGCSERADRDTDSEAPGVSDTCRTPDFNISSNGVDAPCDTGDVFPGAREDALSSLFRKLAERSWDLASQISSIRTFHSTAFLDATSAHSKEVEWTVDNVPFDADTYMARSAAAAGETDDIPTVSASAEVIGTFFRFEELGPAISASWTSCEAAQPFIARAIVANGGQTEYAPPFRSQRPLTVERQRVEPTEPPVPASHSTAGNDCKEL